MQYFVINACHGGFGLSDEALALFSKLKGFTKEQEDSLQRWDIARDDPILIQVIETLGASRCNTPYSKLKIVEVPDDVICEIDDYDGLEWVAEMHRTWS